METREDLFDRAAEYEAMLDRGLRLTGEQREYFVQGRLALLRDLLGPGAQPDRILDFGCGTGETCESLARAFPGSRVTGVDTATQALEHAHSRHARAGIEFATVDALPPDPAFDLCYVNGVFHHIRPEARAEALHFIRDRLTSVACLALFENNPWNPGTRLVMRRIPFDRDARTISPAAGRRLLERNGFELRGPARHLFFFPAALRGLRHLEPYLRSVPLGGQYLLLSTPRPERSPGDGNR